jgi:hypothetical protein
MVVKPLIYNGRVVPAQLPRNREMRKDENFRQLASGHAMAGSDMEGHVWRDALKTRALLGRLLLRSPHYGAKNRPAWFSGEVLCHEGYGSIMYAGIQQPEMNCYKCY